MYFILGTAKVYEKCELARELVWSRGFECELMDDWLCLIEHESGDTTQAYNNNNFGGSFDYGLYQDLSGH